MQSYFRGLLLTLMCMANPAFAQKNTVVTARSALTYADVADLATGAPITLEARIRKATKITGPAAVGVLLTHQRFLIEADVTALIRGPGTLPPRINYLFDAPRDAKGKLPKLVKMPVILFADAVRGRSNQVQLSAPDAQIAATPQDSQRIRSILSAATAPDSPPTIVGVGNAFHVTGTLQGEGETQIFLQSDDGRPLSFTIVRSSGSAPSWSVSIGEIVDSAAPQPAPDTFLWYRLACFVPANLPSASVADASAEDARIIAEDYRLVVAGLGVCQRARLTRP
ncbi:MAG: hypothetical protein ACKVOJ_09405 [Sphingomonadaceae bacterium]